MFVAFVNVDLEGSPFCFPWGNFIDVKDKSVRTIK